MYAQTALLGVLFVIWVAGRDRFQGALVGVVEDLFVAGSGSGAQVAQRGTSLAAFGSGLPELFVKLFLVTVLYAALAGGVVLLSTRGRLGLPADSRAVVTYLAAGFFPLTGLFVAYYLGSPTLAFRQLGFAAVVLSVLGAVGIHALLAGAGTRPAGTRRAVRAGVAVILVVGLVLSLATVFPSPYVYKTSQHVTDQHLSGYETAFDHRADDVPYVGVDTGWDRFGDAVYGPAASSDIDYVRGSVETSVVEPAAFNGGDVASLYDDTRYMPLTDAAEVREVAVYDELYYTASGFESLDSQPRLDRVQSNGDFRLYVVRGSAAA